MQSNIFNVEGFNTCQYCGSKGYAPGCLGELKFFTRSLISLLRSFPTSSRSALGMFRDCSGVFRRGATHQAAFRSFALLHFSESLRLRRYDSLTDLLRRLSVPMCWRQFSTLSCLRFHDSLKDLQRRFSVPLSCRHFPKFSCLRLSDSLADLQWRVSVPMPLP